MLKETRRLDNLGPVCWTNVKMKTHFRHPDPSLFSNISILWKILELVVQDWNREVSPHQEAINKTENQNSQQFYALKAFSDLQTCYLKCLFSYAMFFIALEGAYDKFYEQLNELNRKPFLRVAHDKKPKTTAYIEKIRMIRNISITHMGSSKKTKAINSSAAMMWQPMTLGKQRDELWDLNKMTFGEMKLRFKDSSGKIIDESNDFAIKGIMEIQKHCKEYLEEYDRVCAAYLQTIHSKLPFEKGDEKFFEFKI